VNRLLERSLARVGNPEYAKQNNSFWLTTLRDDHVRFENGRIVLDFRGKHGVVQHKVISDARLARILKNCHDLPGSELFKYVDETGELRHISSEDSQSLFARDHRPSDHGQGLPHLGRNQSRDAGARRVG
jgi:DNA topoisomerase I